MHTFAFSLIEFIFSQRGISLLSEIPETRTCAQAYIEPHWCACLSWTKIDVGDEKVKKAATALLATINSLTESQREKCETLTLIEVTIAVRWVALSVAWLTMSCFIYQIPCIQIQLLVFAMFVSM